MCIIILEHRQADIREMSFVTSWRHVMTSWHHANTKTITYSDWASRKTIETKKNHLSSTSTSWDRVPPVFDVMTWRHDVTSSCKYKTDNIFELSNPKFHRNKKRIIFLAHLQAEIEKISLGASCCDVMTSQCHAVGLNPKSLNCILWMGPGAMEKWHF